MRGGANELEITVIDEIAKMGMKLPIDMYGNWHWLEKEITFDKKNYLIGAWIRRDCLSNVLEISGQECLLKQ